MSVERIFVLMSAVVAAIIVIYLLWERKSKDGVKTEIDRLSEDGDWHGVKKHYVRYLYFWIPFLILTFGLLLFAFFISRSHIIYSGFLFVLSVYKINSVVKMIFELNRLIREEETRKLQDDDID